jgi:pimeloyl-ACP methyl ester carboxylesterase
MASIPNHAAGSYAAVNGIRLYYESRGLGLPLVLLHGGFGSGEMFAALIPALAQKHQVITVDLYGHGRTALTERPMRFEDMADDVAGLIQHLGLASAAVLGYSLGGAVALQTAFRHPERISKLVVLSSPYKHVCWYPEIRAGMGAITAELMMQTPLYEAYKQVAPKPDDFPKLVANMREVMTQEYDWSAQVRALHLPTLIIAGDADSFAPAHAAQFFALLGGGQRDAGWDGAHLVPSQLAILPGTTHYNSVFRADVLLPVLATFLGGTPAA